MSKVSLQYKIVPVNAVGYPVWCAQRENTHDNLIGARAAAVEYLEQHPNETEVHIAAIQETVKAEQRTITIVYVDATGEEDVG
jgi:hypothetical protein